MKYLFLISSEVFVLITENFWWIFWHTFWRHYLRRTKIQLIGQFLLFVSMCTVHNWGHTSQKQQLAGRPAGICSLPTGVWNRLYRGNWLTNAMCLLAFKVTTNHSELGLWISFGKWKFLGIHSEQILVLLSAKIHY